MNGVVKSLLKRYLRDGLTDGQRAVLSALDVLSNEIPDPIKSSEIVQESGRSKVFVNNTLYLFAELGYVRLLKQSSCLRVLLLYLPDEIEEAA